jgi:hypothetical protein
LNLDGFFRMLIDGAIVGAKCPSPPRSVGAHRAVIAASRFGSVGTQVAASAERFSGNVSPKVVANRDDVAVSETRSSSRLQLFAQVAACFPRWSRAGSVCARRRPLSRPEPVSHLTSCCSRHLTRPHGRSRNREAASNAAER